MKEYRPFFIGFGIGFGLGMLSFFFQPADMVQRLGVGVLFIGGVSLLVWLSCFVLDQGLKAFKLHKLFVQFMIERARRGKL